MVLGAIGIALLFSTFLSAHTSTNSNLNHTQFMESVGAKRIGTTSTLKPTTAGTTTRDVHCPLVPRGLSKNNYIFKHVLIILT